jgi:hypothetical protein
MLDSIVKSVTSTLGVGATSTKKKKKKGPSPAKQLASLRKVVSGLKRKVRAKVSRRRY